MLSLRMDDLGKAAPLHEGGSPFHALMAGRMVGERTLVRLSGGGYLVAVVEADLAAMSEMGVAVAHAEAVGEVRVVEVADVAAAMRAGVCARLLRFPGGYRHPRQAPDDAPVVPEVAAVPARDVPTPTVATVPEPRSAAGVDEDSEMIALLAEALGRPLPRAARPSDEAIRLQMALDLPAIERMARARDPGPA